MKGKLQILKAIGAGVIILAAVIIMLPGLMDYAASLSRLAMWVSFAIAIAVSFAFVVRRLKPPKAQEHEKH